MLRLGTEEVDGGERKGYSKGEEEGCGMNDECRGGGRALEVAEVSRHGAQVWRVSEGGGGGEGRLGD